MFIFALKAFCIGFILAASIGPISMLALRRAFTSSLRTGLMTGFGCAFADCTLAAIPAYGLTFVSDWIVAYQYWLSLSGGILLIVIGGIYTLQQPIPAGETPPTITYTGAFTSGYALTIINPANIFAFMAAFAAAGFMEQGFDMQAASLLVLGCLIGALAAWSLAITLPYMLAQKHAERYLPHMAKGCGILLIIGGIFVVLTV